MRIRSILAAAAAFLCLAFLGTTPAMACHEGDDTATCESSHTPTGIPLAPLKHDQITPLYNHFGTILNAAYDMAKNPEWEGQAREDFINVLTFTRHTYGNAWWGYAPGDVLNSDANPWHLPTHAYLRGAYELLERMRKAEPSNPAITKLYDTVNNDMYGLMGTCYYSNTPFNTLDNVTPDWSNTDLTPYAWYSAIGLLVLLMAGLNLLFVKRLHPVPSYRGFYPSQES